MKETICTIPINDIFEVKKGCPFCRMYGLLEEKYVNFIVGDAMMEVSVRIQVNEKGFCGRHLDKIIGCGSRLPTALMLQTHLQELAKTCTDGNLRKSSEKLLKICDSCFVCEKIDSGFNLMCASLLEHWKNEEDFRTLYAGQEYVCPRHSAGIIRAALESRKLKGAQKNEFCKTTLELTRKHVETLENDVSDFCRMYDYRNRGEDFSACADSIERSAEFLKSENEK